MNWLLQLANLARRPGNKRQCEHLWEYVSGPDHAANWLCSRCEAEMVSAVTPRQPR